MRIGVGVSETMHQNIRGFQAWSVRSGGTLAVSEVMAFVLCLGICITNSASAEERNFEFAVELIGRGVCPEMIETAVWTSKRARVHWPCLQCAVDHRPPFEIDTKWINQSEKMPPLLRKRKMEASVGPGA